MTEPITNLPLMTQVIGDVLYRVEAAGSSCGHQPLLHPPGHRGRLGLFTLLQQCSPGAESRAREGMRSCTAQHTKIENTSLAVPAVRGRKEPFSERRAPSLFCGTGRSLVQGVWQQSWPGSRPISPHTPSVKRSGSCILC